VYRQSNLTDCVLQSVSLSLLSQSGYSEQAADMEREHWYGAVQMPAFWEQSWIKP